MRKKGRSKKATDDLNPSKNPGRPLPSSYDALVPECHPAGGQPQPRKTTNNKDKQPGPPRGRSDRSPRAVCQRRRSLGRLNVFVHRGPSCPGYAGLVKGFMVCKRHNSVTLARASLSGTGFIKIWTACDLATAPPGQQTRLPGNHLRRLERHYLPNRHHFYPQHFRRRREPRTPRMSRPRLRRRPRNRRCHPRRRPTPRLPQLQPPRRPRQHRLV